MAVCSLPNASAARVDDKQKGAKPTPEVGTQGAVGTILYLEVTVDGQPVTAVADSGSQATIISRAFLHQISNGSRGIELFIMSLQGMCPVMEVSETLCGSWSTKLPLPLG